MRCISTGYRQSLLGATIVLEHFEEFAPVGVLDEGVLGTDDEHALTSPAQAHVHALELTHEADQPLRIAPHQVDDHLVAFFPLEVVNRRDLECTHGLSFIGIRVFILIIFHHLSRLILFIQFIQTNLEVFP